MENTDDPLWHFQRLQTRELPVYIAAEKILAEHEPLRQDWSIHGTTGYELCRLTNRLFIDLETQTMLRLIAPLPGRKPILTNECTVTNTQS